MFSIFPPLLSYQLFAPLLLRVTLGIIFIIWSRDKFKKRITKIGLNKETSIATLEGIIGIFLIVGFLTQVVALASAIILGKRLFSKIRSKAFFTDGVNYYFILFIISICLIFTGAGFIAFDLPL